MHNQLDRTFVVTAEIASVIRDHNGAVLHVRFEQLGFSDVEQSRYAATPTPVEKMGYAEVTLIGGASPRSARSASVHVGLIDRDNFRYATTPRDRAMLAALTLQNAVESLGFRLGEMQLDDEGELDFRVTARD
jgi:hypothetical protein